MPASILVETIRLCDVSMGLPTNRRRPPANRPGHWTLQDAKARLSELMRRARTEGPQHVTVHGQEQAVLLSPEEFRRLQGWQTGQALVDALQASPHKDIDLDLPSVASPVRDVAL
jgi:prevent-host-death family protein